MTTLPITLEDADRDFIRQELETGRYESESELVAEAIAEMKERQNKRKVWPEYIRRAVREGIEQAERGEYVEFTAEDVIAEGRACNWWTAKE